jgi:hypothetical protein
MNFYFYNPHRDPFFGITLLNFISKIHSTTRYRYLIKFYLKRYQKINLFITKNSTSLPSYLSSIIPIRLEIFFWAIINNINPFKINLKFNINQLKSTDVLFSTTLRNFDLSKLPPLPKNHKFFEFLHITHLSHHTSRLVKNLINLKPNLLIAENNLFKNSPYFRKYFKFYQKDVYTLPFTFEDRFISFTPFNQRKNRCLATGSLAITNQMGGDKNQYSDFESFFHVNTLYPLRKEIYENSLKIKKYVDSYISKVFNHVPKVSNSKDNLFKKLLNSIYNGISISRHRYYKFDIVKKYNQYKMFVIPEEINDLPGIGFVEGMACGCAYLGKIDPMYSDHYIGYDGTLTDLLKKISYYQKHPKALKKIASQGYNFVTKHFNGQTVANNFFNDIESHLTKS